MNEVVIQHLAPEADLPARVRVSYRRKGEAAVESAEIVPFTFALTRDEQDLLRWYWEEYGLSPWGENVARAKQAEELLDRVGRELFSAVFRGTSAAALYQHLALDLGNCRLTIQADTAAGMVLPWEWMRDPARGDYGNLAAGVHSFVRGGRASPLQPMAASPTAGLLNILFVPSRGETAAAGITARSLAGDLFELTRPHLSRLRLEVLRPATAAHLSQALEERPGFFHVVHLEHPSPIEAERLADIFAQCRGMTLVWHRTRPGNGDFGAGLAALGTRLLEGGVHTAMILPHALAPAPALRFFARFYEGLANGESVSRAVSLGREELRSRPQRRTATGELSVVDWAVPWVFEAFPNRLAAKPASALRLNADQVAGQQAVWEGEIDCPPRPVFGLLGRQDEFAAIEDLFEKNNQVLLWGDPGVGKTDLAVGFARWWIESGGFSGPVLFLNRGYPLPVSAIYDRVGAIFEAEIKQDMRLDWAKLDASARARVATLMLRQNPLLLILDGWSESPPAGFVDNEEQWTREQQEWRELLNALRGGQTRIVVTTDDDPVAMGLDLPGFAVAGLGLGPAQELTIRVLAQSGMRQFKMLSPYNDLLAFLEGNPLAIQILAPMLRRQGSDPLLAGLRNTKDKRIEASASPAAITPAALALAYRFDTLDPVFRSRLGILGMFHGFVSARVLAAIGWRQNPPSLLRGMGRDEWIRVLDSAAEMGLLQKRTEGTYAIPSAVAGSFRALLQASFGPGLPWLEEAFSAVYGRAGNQLYSIHQANADFALSLLRAEELNFFACFLLARRLKLWDDLKENLCGIRTLLISQGRWCEWEQWITSLEREIIARQRKPPPEREILWLRLLGHRAEIAEYRGDEPSQKAIRQLLQESYDCLNQPQSDADVLHDLGAISEANGQFEEAERYYQKSLAMKQRQGDESGQASLMEHLAHVAFRQRQYREAGRWQLLRLEICSCTGNAQGQADALRQLGRVEQEKGDFEEARQHYQRSLELYQQLDCPREQSKILHQIGRIAQAERHFDDAEQLYHQSLRLKQSLNDEHGQARSLHQLGNLCFYRQQFAEARAWYSKALEIRQRLGEVETGAQTLYRLGNVAFVQEDFEEAARFYQQSLALREQIGDTHNQARLLNLLGKVAMTLGQRDQAHQYYERAEALYDQSKDILV
jgi:tetratricopeptide (TPR) repeat protein